MKDFWSVLVLMVGITGCTVEEEFVSGATVKVNGTIEIPAGVVVISQKTDFGGPQASGVNALRGLVYFVPNGTSSLVDTSGGKAVAALYSTRLDIAPRSWESGFPGVPGGRNEWFQVVYEGEFVTSHKGGHQFELLSDDGSKLIIDGTTVINNDGRHEPKSEEAIAVMKPGRHKIRVEYFQGPRVEIALQLFVTPPGGQKQILDVSHVL